MKRILSIFFIILLFTTLNGEDIKINEKTMRMIKHIIKIKNFLRNLQISDTSSDLTITSNEGTNIDTLDTNTHTEGNTFHTEGITTNTEDTTSSTEALITTSTEALTTTPTEVPTTTPTETTTPIETTTSDEDTSISIESESSPSSLNSTDPLTANPNFKGKNRKAKINILAFKSFKVRGKSIKFIVFLFFSEPPIAKKIVFILTIRYRRSSGLRYLQEIRNETATCTTDSQKTDGNIKYNCNSENEVDYDSSFIDQVAIVDLKIDDVPLNELDINFSDEALLAASNLQNYTSEIEEMYVLKNGTLNYANKYFIIKGDIDDDEYQGKDGSNLTLSVYDNDIIKNASCNIHSVTNKKYQFRCTSEEEIHGNLHLSPMYYDNDKKVIYLYMNEGNDTLSFRGSVNGNTLQNNPIYKKSSSGLSGGAIAGIIIACAVVLIIASIIAMMLRKSSVPINNDSTIKEFRTIDNYTQ